jgi:Protein of unknown function (DUF3662)/FHA domain
MNLLRTLENTISGFVEGAFGRVFRSEVRPMELARKLAREMDEHRLVTVARVYAPHEYVVWLSPDDFERLQAVHEEVVDELCAHLLEHARREDLVLAAHVSVVLRTDEQLALGEFGIEVKPLSDGQQGDQQHEPELGALPEPPPAAPGGSVAHGAWAAPGVSAAPGWSGGSAAPGGSGGSGGSAGSGGLAGSGGHTMIYSSSKRAGERLGQARVLGGPPRALLAVGGRRLLIPSSGGIVGRSRECDIVLDDSGVSRQHAELRPAADGWVVVDLGSTNGVRVNGRRIQGEQPLSQGETIELGSTEMVFELR